MDKINFQAGQSFSGKDHVLVKLNSSGQMVLCGAGDNACGVLQDASPSLGESGPVVIDGKCSVRLGGTVTVGDFLTTGANGLAVAFTDTDLYLAGQALQSGVTGSLVEMKFIGSVLNAAATEEFVTDAIETAITDVVEPAIETAIDAAFADGVSGTFEDANGQIVTVVDGLITSIV